MKTEFRPEKVAEKERQYREIMEYTDKAVVFPINFSRTNYSLLQHSIESMNLVDEAHESMMIFLRQIDNTVAEYLKSVLIDSFMQRHRQSLIVFGLWSAALEIRLYEMVAEMKQKIQEIFSEFGAIHMQIGKSYPYMHGRQQEAEALLREIKKQLDPDGLMNPGGLGL